RGFGDIAMTVDKQNELNLAGKYTIDEGDYLFTLGLERFENLVNKRFVIANGSTINWYGDPYNADIDIDAIYNLKASLAEIMPKDEIGENNYNQRKDVECIMKLKNSLMSPDISFGIELPRATETERSVVANLIQTQHELYKQVFSLLLLNRFSPTANNSGIDEGGRNGTEALSTTASEILSNQLSNWLSKLSDGVNVGLNYRPGDNITSDEIALALSTELFNDKLVISSNFGVAQGNEDNQNQDALIGDVNVEYKLNEDGSFRVRVFSRTNEYDITNANQSQTTSGVGVYYKKEFNTWKEFITPKKKLREQRQ
ncbi:MAG: translocation/assembly module TamB domain-containing protein, partial [Flavobacteriales bacterium]